MQVNNVADIIKDWASERKMLLVAMILAYYSSWGAETKDKLCKSVLGVPYSEVQSQVEEIARGLHNTKTKKGKGKKTKKQQGILGTC
jgi:hypothetical protein